MSDSVHNTSDFNITDEWSSREKTNLSRTFTSDNQETIYDLETQVSVQFDDLSVEKALADSFKRYTDKMKESETIRKKFPEPVTVSGSEVLAKKSLPESKKASKPSYVKPGKANSKVIAKVKLFESPPKRNSILNLTPPPKKTATPSKKNPEYSKVIPQNVIIKELNCSNGRRKSIILSNLKPPEKKKACDEPKKGSKKGFSKSVGLAFKYITNGKEVLESLESVNSRRSSRRSNVLQKDLTVQVVEPVVEQTLPNGAIMLMDIKNTLSVDDKTCTSTSPNQMEVKGTIRRFLKQNLTSKTTQNTTHFPLIEEEEIPLKEALKSPQPISSVPLPSIDVAEATLTPPTSCDSPEVLLIPSTENIKNENSPSSKDNRRVTRSSVNSCLPIVSESANDKVQENVQLRFLKNDSSKVCEQLNDACVQPESVEVLMNMFHRVLPWTSPELINDMNLRRMKLTLNKVQEKIKSGEISSVLKFGRELSWMYFRYLMYHNGQSEELLESARDSVHQVKRICKEYCKKKNNEISTAMSSAPGPSNWSSCPLPIVQSSSNTYTVPKLDDKPRTSTPSPDITDLPLKKRKMINKTEKED